jgi:hypothetical protein
VDGLHIRRSWLSTITLSVLFLAGCGSSTTRSTTSSNTPSSPSAAVTPTSGAATPRPASGECPLTQAEVDAAFGEHVPLTTPGQARLASERCTFAQDPTNLLAGAVVSVESFPQSGMASTPPAQRQKLDSIGQRMTSEERAKEIGTLKDEPWGKGGFLEIVQHPGSSELPQSWTEVIVWLPTTRTAVERPGNSPAVAESATRTAEQIGNVLSKG